MIANQGAVPMFNNGLQGGNIVTSLMGQQLGGTQGRVQVFQTNQPVQGIWGTFPSMGGQGNCFSKGQGGH